MSDCPRPSAGGYAHLLGKLPRTDNNRPQDTNNLKPNQTIRKPNQTFFSQIGRGGSVADRFMDPSSETTYAMLGIGVSVNFPVQVLSLHALLQEQSSQDGSRRMLFPLKTDNYF